MKTQTTNPTAARLRPSALHRAARRAMPLLLACMATLLALPVNAAVTFPDNPLQTGSAYPPPNIMFILDDSGSMASDFMPDGLTNNEITRKNYARNPLYYNPATTYKTWPTGNGSNRRSGGTGYGNAYSDDAFLSSGTNLANNTQTYYVPKTAGYSGTDLTQYWRYEIPSGGGDVIRSEYGASTYAQSAPGFPKNSIGASTGNSNNYTFTMPASQGQLVVTTSGGSHGTNGGRNNGNGDGADLYLILGGGNICTKTSGNNNETCTINNPSAGTYTIIVAAASGYKNVDLDVVYGVDNRCSGNGNGNQWINCTSATPTGRSVSDELTNFATWYSYYRTRSKLAKGSASEAFAQIGSNIRVGFDTIWNRDYMAIPVGTNGGQFSGTNRTSWFSLMQDDVNASGNTPLKGALQRTGKYFEGSGSSGPWGPESGNEQLSCRQSFAILTSDGYWNSNNDYNDPVGDSDATAGATILHKNGIDSYQYTPIRPYIDNFATNPSSQPNTLADVANYYWKRDLRTSLDNNVPSSSADPAFWQHMTTFGLSIGQQGNLNPAVDLVSLTNGSKHWPDPTPTENASRIDDLWHASLNGHGTFVAATDPVKFAQGLVDALATVAARNGSASNVTANSTSFQSDTTVYQASYVSGKWTGELAAYAVSSGSGVASTPTWLASENVPVPASRTILTWGTTTGATFPTATQTGALVRTAGLAPVTGAENASYLTGVQDLEKQNGGLLRDRIKTVLGDIADSSPIYVRDTQTLFVGANDGMLHAFNALTGAERFAYVPRGLNMTDLTALSDPQYVHKWFVDGPVVVSTQAQTTGYNYLVGALGRGGKGLFGLDVTTPGSFAVGDVLWDKTGSAAPADMGQVLGEPLIVKLNDDTSAIIASNGVNSSTGTAALFVINITTGAVIRELDTGYTNGGNGLSAPRGWDNDGNGTVDYVYAGDLQGNLWKFDLTSATSTDWAVANSGSPMFVAKDAANNRQPITAGLALAKDPATGKRWVFVGTGSFMTNSDALSQATQSMYGLIDDASVVTGRTSGGDGDLDKRTIALINGSQTQRGFEPHDDIDASKKGWYIDLLKPPSPGTQEGERLVNRPIIRGTVLVTASMIPPTGETCEAGGRGFINALDAFSGTSLAKPYFDTNGNDDFTDDTIGTGTDEVPVGSIDLGVGMPTLPTIIDDLLIVGGSTGKMGEIKVNPQGVGPRRISWREILRD